jgi:hypothetical protein
VCAPGDVARHGIAVEYCSAGFLAAGHGGDVEPAGMLSPQNCLAPGVRCAVSNDDFRMVGLRRVQSWGQAEEQAKEEDRGEPQGFGQSPGRVNFLRELDPVFHRFTPGTLR